MRTAEDIGDIQYKQKQDDKQEIIQRIEDVLDMGKLMRMNFFDALSKVYDLGYNDGHTAAQENAYDWIDRSEVCKGGD